MTIQLELRELILLLLTFAGMIAGFGKLLLTQIEKRLDERFNNQEELRRSAQAHWDERFAALEKADRARERALLEMRAELPREYVRREDHIRFETVINAKLDALYSEIRRFNERQPPREN